MAEHILFVFEGEKTERIIADSLLEYFIKDDDRRVVKSSFNTDIYTLYRDLSEDDDLDIFALIKGRNESLSSFSRDSFSQIFLFFDYDGHSNNSDDNKIIKLMDFFCEETDKGKLYVSYPMIEALKCIGDLDDEDDFYNHKYAICDGSSFKSFVVKKSCQSLIHFKSYSRETWNSVIRLHCCKANVLLNDNKNFPTLTIEQRDIFCIQKKNFIDVDKHVSILGAFPFLLLDFFGAAGLSEMVIGPPISNGNAFPQENND